MSDARTSRIDTLEREVKSAALLYAQSIASDGERLPRVRFLRRDFVVMEINHTDRRNYGWKPVDIVSALGADIAASVAELHVIKSFGDEAWDRILLSFVHERGTNSVNGCVLSYHRD